MGESSGLARFAGWGIASTRAFTMRLAVIGQRLGCKRRSCQLNDFPCPVPARPPLLLAPCTLIAPLISYLTSSIRIKSNPSSFHQLRPFRTDNPSPIHSPIFCCPFFFLFCVTMRVTFPTSQSKCSIVCLSLSLSFFIKLDYVLTNSL